MADVIHGTGRTMRILMVNHEFPPLGGGGATASRYLSRELTGQGHDVTVLTSHIEKLPTNQRLDGVEVVRLPCRRRNVERTVLAESTRFVAAACAWSRKMARDVNWDIVQTFFALPNGPAGHVASRTASCPHVIRLSGGDLPDHDPDRYRLLERVLRPATRWVLARADGLVVNSAGLYEKARACYPGLDFEVIPNGADLQAFVPATPPVRRGGPVRLLFVSRLIERKGLQFLLPALADLRRAGHRFSLTIVGDGPMRSAAEQLVEEYQLQDSVHLHGAQPREALPAIYRTADVFVLPSLSEGMPNVVLEAMASGLPVVGTKVAGVEELVREGHNGWLAETGSVDDLKQRLAQALTCRDIATLGRNSRLEAENRSWGSVAAAYEALYSRLLTSMGHQADAIARG